MFIRGGIDNTVRPICQDDVNAETSDCAISIEVRYSTFDYLFINTLL
jgi:hypothetical protein